jgi:hypothetical protein
MEMQEINITGYNKKKKDKRSKIQFPMGLLTAIMCGGTERSIL